MTLTFIAFCFSQEDECGGEETFKPTCAGKTRYSTQRNLGIFYKLMLLAIERTLTEHLGCL